MKVFFASYGKVAVGVVVILLGVVAFVQVAQSFAPRTLRVTFFDVGQGDAIFIQTPGGRDMLIDGGPNKNVLEELIFSSTQKNPTSPQKKTSYNNVEDAVFEDISEKHP